MKPSSDPVRINNSSFSVETAGIAAGAYRLVSDKTKFHLNNMTSLAASLPSGNSGNYEIYGDYPSSSMFDAELSLKTVEGTTLCTMNITVLWVDISMRFGQDDPFSADNDFTAFATNRVLGAQKFAYIGYEEGIGNVVEIRGDVHPQNFNARIEFQRDNIARSTCVFTTNGTPVYSSVNQSIPRRTEPEGNDECVEAFGDYNPPPNGHVYDVDTPGFPNYFLTAYPNGHYFLVRMNFAQYAVYNGRRCANDFLWFSRTTVIRAMQNGHYGFDFLNRNGRMDDNVSGTGSTDILW